jgi:prepilin-type N-terminal cleavage/methylation domain-containing protein
MGLTMTIRKKDCSSQVRVLFAGLIADKAAWYKPNGLKKLADQSRDGLKQHALAKSAGFTLIELLVTVIISSVFFLIVGKLCIASFQSGMDASARIQAEYNIMYFQKNLENMFHGATKDPVVITTTWAADDTLRFASYTSARGLTQNEYRMDAAGTGNLIRTYWNSTYVAGVLTPVNPYGGGGGTVEILVPNVASVHFQTNFGGRDMWLGITTSTPLPGGGTFIDGLGMALLVVKRNERT